MSYALSEHVIKEIEHWKTRFPEGRQRSVVISALHALFLMIFFTGQPMLISIPSKA